MSEASSAFGSASPRTAQPKTNTGGHSTIEPLSGPPTDGRLQSLTSPSGHFLQLSHDSKRSPAEGHRPDAGDIVPGWRC